MRGMTHRFVMLCLLASHAQSMRMELTSLEMLAHLDNIANTRCLLQLDWIVSDHAWYLLKLGGGKGGCDVLGGSRAFFCRGWGALGKLRCWIDPGLLSRG